MNNVIITPTGVHSAMSMKSGGDRSGGMAVSVHWLWFGNYLRETKATEMSFMKHLVPSLAVALAGIFFGIAAYINLAEQPARLALAAGPMLAQWKISFAVGIAIQGALAIVTGVAGLLSWWLIRDTRWAIGGLLMLANWPWTLAFIAPINSALNGIAPEAAGAASIALVEQWGQFHSVRTSIGFCALLMFVWALTYLLKAGEISR